MTRLCTFLGMLPMLCLLAGCGSNSSGAGNPTGTGGSPVDGVTAVGPAAGYWRGGSSKSTVYMRIGSGKILGLVVAYGERHWDLLEGLSGQKPAVKDGKFSYSFGGSSASGEFTTAQSCTMAWGRRVAIHLASGASLQSGAMASTEEWVRDAGITVKHYGSKPPGWPSWASE